MPDAFALLDLPRRPWLTPESVRAAFQRRAAAAHPDVGGNASDFSELTRAHETLRSPATRLKLLMELEPPMQPGPAHAVPPDLVELFSKISRAGGLKKMRKSMPGSGVGPDWLAPPANLIREELRDVQRIVVEELRRAEETLREVDADWPEDLARSRLADLQGRFAFLEKWLAQIKEAVLELEIG